MTQKLLIITAFFCATQLAQAADLAQAANGNPPTRDKEQPKSGSFAPRVRPQSAPVAELTPPSSQHTSPLAEATPGSTQELSTVQAVKLLTPSPELPLSSFTQKIRRSESGDLSELVLACKKDRGEIEVKEAQQFFEPHPPAGRSNLKKTTRYTLGIRTNLLAQLNRLQEQKAPEQATPKEQTPEYTEALELYRESQALLEQLTREKVKLLASQHREDLENLKTEAEETGNNTQFKEWMESFYDGLLEQKRKHEERLAKELKQEKRREHIKRSRSALGLDELRCVLFKSPESTPNALVVSPTTVLGEVFNDKRQIPHRDERDEKKFEDNISGIQLRHLVQEYWAASNLKEQTTIKESLKAFLTLHPYLQTEETTMILESVTF